MRTIFLTLTCLLLCLCSCVKEPDKMQVYVENFFKQYPEATLLDIYKGSFQDVFGPAHLLTDREAVIRYIQYEMKNSESYEEHDYIPCGWQANFYQVNLKVIADGRVPMGEFVDAFMASANGINAELTEPFVADWALVQQAIRKVAPHMEGFSQDSTQIATLLQEGKYVMHHSEKFNNHYHPHYRIIRKDLFEEKILPKL